MLQNVSYIEFDIVEACNLRCTYCYLQLGDKTRFSKKTFLTKEIFDKFLELYIKSIDKIEELNISFWGGEPLLRFDMISYMINRFNSFRSVKFDIINYVIVSNGTLITDDIADFCTKNNVLIQITIDGDKKSHDRQRITKNGNGTFDIIVEKIKILKRNNTNYYLRSTLTALTPLPSKIIDNYRFLNIAPNEYLPYPSVKEMISAGFQGGGIGFGMITPVTEYDKQYLLPINYDLIASDLLEKYKSDNFPNKEIYHCNIRRTIFSFFANTPRLSCGVDESKIAVKSDGSIYLCHRMVSNPDFSIGNVFEGITNKYQDKYNSIIEINSHCKDCSYKYMCGGTCFHEISLYGDDYISETTCEFNKKITKVVYKYLVDLYFNNRSYFNKIACSNVGEIKITDFSLLESSTQITGDVIFKKTSNVQCIDLDEEGVFYFKENFGEKYIANSSLMIIWDLIDGVSSSEEIVSTIGNVYKISSFDIRGEIYDSLTAMKELGIIEET